MITPPELADKVIRVVESCETVDQRMVAERYTQLATSYYDREYQSVLLKKALFFYFFRESCFSKILGKS